jgi:hypothetical protein
MSTMFLRACVSCVVVFVSPGMISTKRDLRLLLAAVHLLLLPLALVSYLGQLLDSCSSPIALGLHLLQLRSSVSTVQLTTARLHPPL